MELSRRGLLTVGTGTIASGVGGYTLHPFGRNPRAWRVSYVDCDEPIVEGYDGARFYATLLISQAEANDRLLETECFGPGRREYLTIDYDEFVVSVRTAALPAGATVETVSYEFDDDTLEYALKVTEGADVDQERKVLQHVVTTWELNGAKKPSQIRLDVRDGHQTVE